MRVLLALAIALACAGSAEAVPLSKRDVRAALAAYAHHDRAPGWHTDGCRIGRRHAWCHYVREGSGRDFDDPLWLEWAVTIDLRWSRLVVRSEFFRDRLAVPRPAVLI